jgi:hypothetical protein
MFAKSVIKIENEEVNFIIDLFINNHAIVSSVFGIGQIIVYLVHFISVKLREITQILKKQDSYYGIKHFWKFTDDTD